MIFGGEGVGSTTTLNVYFSYISPERKIDFVAASLKRLSTHCMIKLSKLRKILIQNTRVKVEKDEIFCLSEKVHSSRLRGIKKIKFIEGVI